MSGNGWDKIIGAIVIVLVIGAALGALGLLAAAAAGAYGAYALASAAGAGKGLSIAAGAVGLIAAPAITAKLWKGHKERKKERERKKWQSSIPSFNLTAAPTPQPAPAPVMAPQPAAPQSDIPPIFTEAMEKLQAMDPDERNKYLKKLSDAFPDEVETLRGYDERMALKKPATAMKPLTLVGGKKNASL